MTTTDDKSVSDLLSAFDAATIERARVAVREYMDWISDTGGDETGKLSPFAQDALVHQFAWYLSRRSHQEGWRPIETAPKDGTCIYLAWNSEDWTMAEGMWRGDEWVTSATFYNPDLPHPRMEFREYRPNNPLWWQPLPAAPSPKEGK